MYTDFKKPDTVMAAWWAKHCGLTFEMAWNFIFFSYLSNTYNSHYKTYLLVCLFLTEEILYSIKRGQTMAYYCNHLCWQGMIPHSIMSVVQSRELGQAPILVFLILMQALSSPPRQHMVWLYMSASCLLGLQGPQQALAEHICYILDTTPSTVMAACWAKHCGLTCQLV